MERPRRRVAVVAWGEIGEHSTIDGYASRNFSIVQHLARENDVLFVSLHFDGRVNDIRLPSCVPVVTISVPTPTTSDHVRDTAFTAMGRVTVHPWQRAVVAALESFRADVALTMWQVRIPWLGKRVPTIMFLEEDGGDHPEFADASRLHRAKQRLDRAALRRAQRAAVGIGVISPMEVAWASRVSGGRPPVRVVPHWASEPYWSGLPRHAEAEQERVIAVVGHIGLGRTAMGLRQIVDHLLAMEPTKRPQLIVASSVDPHPCLQGLPEDVVKFIGRVEDVRELYARAAATLVPSFVVMGAKTTILQAWAAGIPVVTTTAAAASVAAVHGHDVLAGSNAAEVASALVEIVESREARTALAEAGRLSVRARHGQTAVGEAVDSLLALVPSDGGPRWT